MLLLLLLLLLCLVCMREVTHSSCPKCSLTHCCPKCSLEVNQGFFAYCAFDLYDSVVLQQQQQKEADCWKSEKWYIQHRRERTQRHSTCTKGGKAP